MTIEKNYTAGKLAEQNKVCEFHIDKLAKEKVKQLQDDLLIGRNFKVNSTLFKKP